MQWVEYIESFNMLSVFIRLILAILMGGIIGWERASKGHAAGLRTFALVCLGASLATITNIYINQQTGGDASRIPSGIMSGIGFLGVGTIIVTKRNHIRGLTTAAGLWVTATLGISLGTGMIRVSLIAFLLLEGTIALLEKVSRKQEEKSRMLNLYLEVDKEPAVRTLMKYLYQQELEVCSVEKKREDILSEGEISILLELDLKKRKKHKDLIEQISLMDGILYLEEIRS